MLGDNTTTTTTTDEAAPSTAKASTPNRNNLEPLNVSSEASCSLLLPPDRYNVLVEFAHKHLDFQLDELESVLDMYGISLHHHQGNDEGCLVIPLPNAPSIRDISNNNNNIKNDEDEEKHHHHAARSFVILSFPSPSTIMLQQSASAAVTDDDGDNNTNYSHHNNNNKISAGLLASAAASTAINSHLPNNNKKRLADILHQCTLVRSAVELWGMGHTLDECAAQTHAWVHISALGKMCWDQACRCCDDEHDGVVYRNSTMMSTNNNNNNSSIIDHHRPLNLPSWKITVHTLGSKYKREEQDDMRRQYMFLDFPGPVRMEDPTYEFVLIREVELDDQGSPLYPRHSHVSDGHGGKVLIPEHDARPPLACYFGRVLAGGDGGTQRTFKGRGGVEQYSLKKRAYLGPTSMDAELSFVMTNLGQVRPGSFCFDPFVGTGSILLSCAARGAYCFGSDIDIRVLRGMNKDSNVFTNFEQFQLPRPELVRSDNAIYHRHFRPHRPLYDAIVCDPPYGIRAGARKSGSRLEHPKPVDEDQRHDHIAQTKPYAVSDVMSDLLDMAACTLVMNGRLVYVIPSYAASFDNANNNINDLLPQHACLEIIHTCFQPLSLELGRRIVTMKKGKEYDVAQRETYMAAIWKNGSDSAAETCVNIRDKILQAAKKKPGYAEKAQFRKQKRREHREVKKRAKLGHHQKEVPQSDNNNINSSNNNHHDDDDQIHVAAAPSSET